MKKKRSGSRAGARKECVKGKAALPTSDQASSSRPLYRKTKQIRALQRVGLDASNRMPCNEAKKQHNSNKGILASPLEDVPDSGLPESFLWLQEVENIVPLGVINLQMKGYLPQICEHILSLDTQFNKKLGCKLPLNQRRLGVTTQMRSILLRWLVQIGQSFTVCPETMQLCVHLVDYVLIFSGGTINRSNFQLLGITALFVASKYNEVQTMEADRYVQMCDGLYGLQQMLDMESTILNLTQFNLQLPMVHQFTCGVFLNCLLGSNKVAPRGQPSLPVLRDSIRMLTSLSLFDFQLSNCFRKVHLSVVIIYFAAKLLSMQSVHCKALLKQVGMRECEFQQCFMLLLDLYESKHGQSVEQLQAS